MDPSHRQSFCNNLQTHPQHQPNEIVGTQLIYSNYKRTEQHRTDRFDVVPPSPPTFMGRFKDRAGGRMVESSSSSSTINTTPPSFQLPHLNHTATGTVRHIESLECICNRNAIIGGGGGVQSSACVCRYSTNTEPAPIYRHPMDVVAKRHNYSSNSSVVLWNNNNNNINKPYDSNTNIRNPHMQEHKNAYDSASYFSARLQSSQSQRPQSSGDSGQLIPIGGFSKRLPLPDSSQMQQYNNNLMIEPCCTKESESGGTVVNALTSKMENHNLNPKCNNNINNNHNNIEVHNNKTPYHASLYMPTPKFSSDKFINECYSAKNNNSNCTTAITSTGHSNYYFSKGNSKILQSHETTGSYDVHQKYMLPHTFAQKTPVINYASQDTKYHHQLNNTELSSSPQAVKLLDGSNNYYHQNTITKDIFADGADTSVTAAAVSHPARKTIGDGAIHVKKENDQLCDVYDPAAAYGGMLIGTSTPARLSNVQSTYNLSASPSVSLGPTTSSIQSPIHIVPNCYNGEMTYVNSPKQESSATSPLEKPVVLASQGHISKKAHIIQKVQKLQQNCAEPIGLVRNNASNLYLSPLQSQSQHLHYPSSLPYEKYEDINLKMNSHLLAKSFSPSTSPMQVQMHCTTPPFGGVSAVNSSLVRSKTPPPSFPATSVAPTTPLLASHSTAVSNTPIFAATPSTSTIYYSHVSDNNCAIMQPLTPSDQYSPIRQTWPVNPIMPGIVKNQCYQTTPAASSSSSSSSSVPIIQPSSSTSFAHAPSASPLSGGLPQGSLKKSQANKPNYRELINQVYAMRNATSEQELNLKIIQKTLNVDVGQQIIRSATMATCRNNRPPLEMIDQTSTPASVASGVLLHQHKNIVDASVSNEQILSIPTAAVMESSSGHLRIPPQPALSVLAKPMQLKLEDENTMNFSPLDLSMRTVKTKADSTELFKSQDLGRTVSEKVNLPRYNNCIPTVAPRFDFTPNFSSLQTNTRKLNQQEHDRSHIKSMKSSSLAPRNGSPLPAALERMAFKPIAVGMTNFVGENVQFGNHDQNHQCDFQNHNNNNGWSNEIFGAVATNSSTRKSYTKSTTTPTATARPTTIVEPTRVAKDNFIESTQSTIVPHYTEGVEQTQQKSPTIREYVRLNKKRVYHPSIVESSTEMLPLKCARMQQSHDQAETPVENNVMNNSSSILIKVNPCIAKVDDVGTIKLMADTTHPSCNMLQELPKTNVSNSVISTGAVSSSTIQHCLKEPAAPNVPQFSGSTCMIKTENGPSSMAARIRTKAELKGFTFNLPPMPISPSLKTPVSTNVPIRLDKSVILHDHCTDNILDSNWNRTLMNLVEQLQKNTKSEVMVASASKPGVKINYVNSQSPDNAVSCPTGFMGTCFDTKPELSEVIRVDSVTQEKQLPLTQSIKTVVWPSSGSVPIKKTTTTMIGANIPAKKGVRVDREKLRMQQEKRIAARLQDASSSESDNELNKRLKERLKKPLKKSKSRTAIVTTFCPGKNRFSDCGGSDTSDVSIFLKQRNLKNICVNEVAKVSIKACEVTATNVRSVVKKEGNCSAESKNSTTAHVTTIGKCSQLQKRTPQHSNKKTTLDAKLPKKMNNSPQRQYTQGKLIRMTRSKQKRELELQLANSKVLRNDKIVRNSTTLIKRKYLSNKFSNQKSGGPSLTTSITRATEKRSSSIKTRSTNKESDIIVTRLRSQKQLTDINSTQKKSTKNKARSALDGSAKKGLPAKHGDSCSTLLNTKKEDMEVYRYKRSLKVPPSLINIQHYTITSALEHDQLKCEKDKVLRPDNNTRSKSIGSQTSSYGGRSTVEKQQPTSIIDLLHSKITNSASTKSNRISRETVIKRNSTENGKISRDEEHLLHIPDDQYHPDDTKSVNGVGDNVDSDNEVDDDEDDDNEDDANPHHKRHFSIFEAKILETKTRNESKQRQRREIIREIFVGSDRPASAPPEMIQPLNNSHDGIDIDAGCRVGTTSTISTSIDMTFEQKFEQFLKEMNGENLKNFGRPLNLQNLSIGSGTVSRIDRKERQPVGNDVNKALEDNIVTVSETMGRVIRIDRNEPQPSIFKRRRPTRYLRRKGSSGFDYLRKKKRYTPSNSNVAPVSQRQLHNKIRLPCNRLLRQEEDSDELVVKTKTESDVHREIQKWVLTKGVGQSTIHKAARLGYIDVIVYCLDRLCMNPDQKDNAGYTPLHEACSNGWLDIARILLQYGANHSEAALSGIRPLHEASENDHEEIVRLLLSYGADPLVSTYSGQTPLILAATSQMRELLNGHLCDISSEQKKTRWVFPGPWQILDPSKCGCNILDGAPPPLDDTKCDMSRALRKSSISGLRKNQLNQNTDQQLVEQNSEKVTMISERCSTTERLCNTLNNNNNTIRKKTSDVETSAMVACDSENSDGEIFEFEEADVLLPPLYRLKGEESSTDMWVLLSDLCNLLKVKSKDTLLNKIYPAAPATNLTATMSVAQQQLQHQHHKSLMRELKLSDFLEKAICMQLLCAGEKFNICASKVVLIKYNEHVRKLLGVKTILMKF